MLYLHNLLAISLHGYILFASLFTMEKGMNTILSEANYRLRIMHTYRTEGMMGMGMGAGEILIFADCMPIGPDEIDETNRYAGIVQQYFADYEVHLAAYSGDTSMEAVEYLKDIRGNYQISSQSNRT